MEARNLFYMANIIHLAFCPEIKKHSIKEKVKDLILKYKIKLGQIKAEFSYQQFLKKINLRKYISKKRPIKFKKQLRIWWLFWRL